MSPEPRGDGRFRTTRWSVVVAAGADPGSEGRVALESLCSAYWYPLYAFARRRGEGVETAQDLVQGFFATLLEKDYLAQADRDRGRFRTFLITAYCNYASKERDRASAQKRGGGRLPISLDVAAGEARYAAEPADDRTPERVFERRWALTVLDRVLDALRTEFTTSGRGALFDALLPFVADASAQRPYREIGGEIGMTEGAVKVSVHRLRKRYRHLLRSAVAETVGDDADVDDELRHLIDSL